MLFLLFLFFVLFIFYKFKENFNVSNLKEIPCNNTSSLSWASGSGLNVSKLNDKCYIDPIYIN